MTCSLSTVWKFAAVVKFASRKHYADESSRVAAFAIKDSRINGLSCCNSSALYSWGQFYTFKRRGVTGFSQNPARFPFDRHIINTCRLFLFFPYNFTGHICHFFASFGLVLNPYMTTVHAQHTFSRTLMNHLASFLAHFWSMSKHCIAFCLLWKKHVHCREAHVWATRENARDETTYLPRNQGKRPF